MEGRKSQKAHNKWTNEQDAMLLDLKQNKKLKSWTTIATEINSLYDHNQRSGKQCRERYMNYVRIGVKTEKNISWTPQQDELLFRKFMIYGPKWVLIIKQFPGKSQNSLKNRFHNAIGRMQRRIKKIERKKKLKSKKPITNNRLINIFQKLGKYLSQNGKGFEEQTEQIEQKHHFDILTDHLIKLAICGEEQVSEQQIFFIIKGIHQFSQASKPCKQQKQQVYDNKFFSGRKIGQKNIDYKGDSNKQQDHLDLASQNPLICLQKQDKNRIQLNQIQERLSLLPELSYQFENISNQSKKNLQQELCLILKQEYVHEGFLFCS